jgi:3-methyladenine DNA glycosylase AlkD
MKANLNAYYVMDDGELFQEVIGAENVLELVDMIISHEYFINGEYVLMREWWDEEQDEVFRFNKY